MRQQIPRNGIRRRCSRCAGAHTVARVLGYAFLIVFTGILAPRVRAVANPGSAATVVRDSAIVIGNGSIGPYWISGYYITVGSDSVLHAGDDILERSQYSLDANNGQITFQDPLQSGDTLIVHFYRLAFALTTEWTAHRESETRLSGVPAYAIAQPVSMIVNQPGVTTSLGRRPAMLSDGGQSIEWQGFKSFSVSTSSGKSSDWSQGLELSVSGEIADGVSLRAAVSDRFSSTQSGRSSGSVTRVGDLDRIFIEAESQKFFGRFGQVSLPAVTQSGSIRQAAGARFAWDGGTNAVDGYLGRATGTPIRRRLAIQPQVAGPYRLSSEGTLGNVIASSVVVIRDGSRLTEGVNADYTFDLATGSITFGPGAVPDAGTVVLVEYERILEEYRRTLAGASWRWQGDRSGLDHRLAVNWEADDPGQPLFGDLSDAQRSVLSQSPRGEVNVPSYEYRGSGDGDYDLNILAGSDSVFTYMGPGNGDWRVGFEYVGVRQGRYRHLAEDAFEYVGPNQGSYEPIATLGAPRSFLTLSESAQLQGTRLGSFEASWFGFADNPNRLSAQSTQMKSNHHLGWSVGSGTNAQSPGRLYVDWWRQESIAERNRSVDDYSRFSQTWQMRDAVFDESRSEYQIGASTNPGGRLSTSFQAGALTSSNVEGLRWNLATRAEPLRHLTATAGWIHRLGRSPNVSDNAGDSQRELQAALQYDVADLTIKTAWQQLDLDNNLRLFETQPEFVSTKTVSAEYASARLQYQWSDASDSVALRRRTRELSLSASLDGLTSVNGQLLVARGEQSFGAGQFTPYYRGRLDGAWHPLADFTVKAEMDLAYTRAGLEQEVYLPTRSGQGQYRLERGEYVPDAYGDYRRVVSRSDEFGPATYDGRQTLLFNWRPVVRGWRWVLESRRDRIARHDPAGFRPQQWLAPWTSYTWNLAGGARAERHDFHRLTVRPGKRTELSIDWTSDRTLFGLDRVRNDRDRLGSSARYDLNTSAYFEAAAEYEIRGRRGGITNTVDAKATTTRFTVGGTSRTRIQWSLEGRRRADDDQQAQTNIRLLGVRPRVQATLGVFNILIESDMTWVQPQRGGEAFSSLLAEGRPEGFSAVEFCEVRWQLPSRVTLKSRLHADLREAGADRWRWDIQTVARF